MRPFKIERKATNQDKTALARFFNDPPALFYPTLVGMWEVDANKRHLLIANMLGIPEFLAVVKPFPRERKIALKNYIALWGQVNPASVTIHGSGVYGALWSVVATTKATQETLLDIAVQTEEWLDGELAAQEAMVFALAVAWRIHLGEFD